MPRRRWPVRAYLQLIVFVLVLPAMAFSALLMLRLSALERARNQQAAEAAAVRTADAVDRELTNIRAALRVLATSPALAAADIPAFDRQARAVGATMGLNIVLTDRDGQQYSNTRSPPGAPLPLTNVTDTLREVVETGRPGLSDLFLGAVSAAPALAVLMPVPERTAPDWVLITSMQPSYLARLLQAQALPPGWIGVVVDGRDTIIARSVDHDRLVGQRASAGLIQHATGERGTWDGTTLDGMAVLAAYARVNGTGWRVAVGVPLGIVRAPFRTTLATLIAAGAGTLALSVLLAWSLGRPRWRRWRRRRRRSGCPARSWAAISGDAAEFQASLSSEPWLILAAVVVIYIVLGVLYESTIHPVTILSTLPSAGIGALLALMLAGQDLSLVALVGIVLLMGIVKKNAIILIDFAIEAERVHGMSPRAAIEEACALRYRPIMMTTAAALLGALPLMLENGTGVRAALSAGRHDRGRAAAEPGADALYDAG